MYLFKGVEILSWKNGGYVAFNLCNYDGLVVC